MARGTQRVRDANPEAACQLVDEASRDELTMGASRKVEWRCPDCGNVYEMSPATRFRNGDAGCPYCSNRRVLPGFNDVATTNPELLAMAVDPEELTRYASGSSKKLEWRCPDCGHVRVATIVDVARRGKGCPACNHVGVVEGHNDLATTHPKIAAMLVDGDAATKVAAKSSKRMTFACEKGHEWEDMVKTVVAHDGECPVCANKRTASGERFTLADVAPHLVEELLDKGDAACSPSSHKRVKWACPADPRHVWETTVAQRVNLGSGCPFCSGRRVLAGVNDLATTHPAVAALLLDREEGSSLGAGSAKKAKWVCSSCGEAHEATVRDMVSRSADAAGKCLKCVGGGWYNRKRSRHATLGELDHPLLAEAVHPELVAKLTVGSGVPVEWRCVECAVPHTYTMSVTKRAHGQGCPVKAGKLVVPGINDLATTHPDLASELVDANDGTMYSKGTMTKLRWRCPEGHEWGATPWSRIAGTGCPECSCIGESKMERDLFECVEKLVGEGNVVAHDTTLLAGHANHGQVPELDMVVPSKKVAIEFNGLFYHSCPEEGGLRLKGLAASPERHKLKHDWAREVGYALFQVWEDDWTHRREAVLRALAAKLGATDRLEHAVPGIDADCIERIGARKCECVLLDPRTAHAFLDANHIQGAVRSSYHFGLRDGEGKLRAVMSVRRGLAQGNAKAGDYEIQRYATRGTVAGGFSKLLRHAERHISRFDSEMRTWVSFSANDISDGSMYAKAGFEKVGDSAPMYYYWGRVTGGERVAKRCFQKHRFEARDDLLYEEGLTEPELAQLNGLHRIYDAGKVKWAKPVVAYARPWHVRQSL